ncbi:hypothetical protein GXW82_15860 [Streptacidiphilus sp. 4-A2]|nr:hypothetical protein [Streptacidiphilus sp. 4-A2]
MAVLSGSWLSSSTAVSPLERVRLSTTGAVGVVGALPTSVAGWPRVSWSTATTSLFSRTARLSALIPVDQL